MIDKNLTPTEFLVFVQKKKYKYVIIPLVMVLLSFILSFQSNHPALKYISLAGLILYLVIAYLFRIKRLYVAPECSSNCTVAPIYGTISSIKDGTITITKKLWQMSEVRNPQQNQDKRFQFSKPVEFFEESSDTIAKLIGIALGNVQCIVEIPNEQKIEVHKGDSVIAGVTILAHEPQNE